MSDKVSSVVADLHRIITGADERAVKARRAAAAIRVAGGYRWVGLYDVGPEEIGVIGWDGPSAPTHPTFPVTKGLNGAAVTSGEAVIVQDVSKDPRYLTTLGSTRAEMILPVRVGRSAAVVGTIDVESEHVDAFGDPDRQLLSACARALLGLWAGAV